MGRFGYGRAAGGEQVDGRQQGIAFDGTMQQEGLAGLAVAQLQGRRRRDALLYRFRRLGTDDGIGALAVETTLHGWREVGIAQALRQALAVATGVRVEPCLGLPERGMS